MSLAVGTRVRVRYHFASTIEATVIEPAPAEEYQYGPPDPEVWVRVRQDSDFEDDPVERRPVFLALVGMTEPL